ncbi:MAG: hypothetical protein JWM62_1539 [Frankiales bacterium]|nr:hypothetical protein [Frankiales bacterium]
MDTATTRTSEAAMALLGHGVPLSLLLDLVCGPRSEELFATEVPAQRQPSS